MEKEKEGGIPYGIVFSQDHVGVVQYFGVVMFEDSVPKINIY